MGEVHPQLSSILGGKIEGGTSIEPIVTGCWVFSHRAIVGCLTDNISIHPFLHSGMYGPSPHLTNNPGEID